MTQQFDVSEYLGYDPHAALNLDEAEERVWNERLWRVVEHNGYCHWMATTSNSLKPYVHVSSRLFSRDKRPLPPRESTDEPPLCGHRFSDVFRTKAPETLPVTSRSVCKVCMKQFIREWECHDTHTIGPKFEIPEDCP